MRLLWCLFLYLPFEIKGQSPSISFVNLIPSFLANVRFFQEDLLNSTIGLDATIEFDLTLEADLSNCTRDMQLLLNATFTRQLWAIKTIDAWGKLPSGVMHGNIFWVGATYECQHLLRGLNETVIPQPISTHACTIGSDLLAKIRPVFGLCVPKTCNATDIIDLIRRHAIKIPIIRNLINLTDDHVRCIEYRRPDMTAVLTIMVIACITFLIVVATGMHAIYGHKHEPKVNIVCPTTLPEPLTARTTTAGSSSPANERSDEYQPSTASDDVTPLVATSVGRLDSVAQNLIACCSLINNYRILKHNSYPKALACLNGVRVLSFCWILLGHTLIFAVYYSDNALTIFNWSRKLWFQLIVQTFFSIDSFFVLSGLLTSFTYFISKVENESFSIGKFVLNHYIYHYLRYTPLYGLVLLIYITLSPYLGQGGPVYPVNGIESTMCRQTWWHNLLYINNFFDMQHGCMPVSWFLAVNMQFHWIAPVFLLIVSWKWLLGMLVSTALIAVDVITTSVIVHKKNYDYGFLSDFYAPNFTLSNTTNGYLNDVYVKPWCRVAPYALGLAVGFILYEVYQRANHLARDPTEWNTRFASRYRRCRQVLTWAVALTILALCLFGTYGDYSGRPLTRQNRIAFLTLSRLGWSTGLCMVIIACFAGHGGVANRLLSQSCFYKLSKLTYGAYLWHSLVIFVNYLGRDQPTHYTMANIIFNFVGYTILSYLLSFATFLLIELPVIQLLKFCFKRSANSQ